jgi:pimeloyl-ACP methyl ester carboxylesterase
MAKVRVDDTLEMAYEVDDFTDPWKQPDAVMLVHGGLKPRQLFYAWIPTLARHLRVIRPFLRGHWGSTPAPKGYHWSIEGFVSDLKNFLDALGLDKVHYVGESLGGVLGYHFAYRHPNRLKTLTTVNSPGPSVKGHRLAGYLDALKRGGVEGAVNRYYTARMEEGAQDPERTNWFNNEMKKCPLEATMGLGEAMVNVEVNIDDFLPKIQVPTLLLTGAEHTRVLTVEEAEHLRRLIPRAKLVAIPGVKGLVMTAAPERCAEEVLVFIRQQASEQTSH